MWGAIRNYCHHAWEHYQAYMRRRSIIYTLDWDSIGLTLSGHTTDRGVEIEHLQWTEITSIYAFKKDCFAVDQIRLYINLCDKTATELTEDMRGWDVLLKELPKYLSGCKAADDWWPIVAFPAFEPNVTLIYESSKPSAV